METKKAIFCLMAALVFFQFSAAAAVKKNIDVSLHDRKIQDLSSSGLVLHFQLRISNSSSSTFYLNRYDYRAVIEQAEYFRLGTTLEDPIPIEPRGETLVSLPLRITYALLFQAFPGLEGNPKLSCYLTGLLVFSGDKRREGKVPFAFSGEFPVYKDPVIELRPLRIKDLTLGGADVVFEAALKNPNNFDLQVNTLSYRVALGGREVTEGTVKNLAVAPGSEKPLLFPLLLEFFEIGNELFEVLQQPSVEGRFSGELTADTTWGRVRLSFSPEAVLTIVRDGSD